MSTRNSKILEIVSGWQAVEIITQCILFGIWQLIQIGIKSLWKGHRRKLSGNFPPVELTVDSSIGTHCYIKIMGVKYHYVELGHRSRQTVLVLGDAPDKENIWGPTWAQIIQKLADTNHHIITLDLRGTGGSETGGRSDLSPPRAVEELVTLMEAFGVSKSKPSIVIGFGIGGMLTWYLAHCNGEMVSKFVVVGAPHPNLYWQYPPTAFSQGVLHFIQWPHFPERWLAEGELQDSEGSKWASSRACDWTGALNYVRGAAWWRIKQGEVTSPPALLVGGHSSAAMLVASAQYCSSSTLRLVTTPDANDPALPGILMEFLVERKEQIVDVEQRSLVGRMLGAMAGRGRELTAKLVLPPTHS